MKSCITWLVERDRNTRFHHTLALVRRRRNRITCIKDQVGNWIHEKQEIADYIRQRYAKLFSTSHNHYILTSWNPPFWQARISEEDSVKLVGTVSDEEIVSGLWSLMAYKAPSPDGLHVGFF